jgi:hypothetical protein
MRPRRATRSNTAVSTCPHVRMYPAMPKDNRAWIERHARCHTPGVAVGPALRTIRGCGAQMRNESALLHTLAPSAGQSTTWSRTVTLSPGLCTSPLLRAPLDNAIEIHSIARRRAVGAGTLPNPEEGGRKSAGVLETGLCRSGAHSRSAPRLTTRSFAISPKYARTPRRERHQFAGVTALSVAADIWISTGSCASSCSNTSLARRVW